MPLSKPLAKLQQTRQTLLKQKFLFLLMVVFVYTALVLWLDFLQGPYWWDERGFWRTSLEFSDRLIPSLNDLRDYEELNTPLPFIVFGALEYLLGYGIAAGRWLNLVLSISIVFIIGWPQKAPKYRSLLCLIGLFLCPYYLWLSGRLYTEMLACVFVLIGFVSYCKGRHWLSGLAFALAIASRQYMLAFPAAIFVYEISSIGLEAFRHRSVNFTPVSRWLSPLAASLTILGWFYLFQGLTPQSALDIRMAPEIQRTAWAVTPGGALNFLGFVGLYIVIPEFLLLNRRFWLDLWLQQHKKVIVIGIALALYVLAFPPLLTGAGNLSKITRMIPGDALEIAFIYSIALIACLRFSRPNLLSAFVFINSFIMMKAFPWDRYVLPLVVVFWYIQAYELEASFSLPKADQENASNRLNQNREAKKKAQVSE